MAQVTSQAMISLDKITTETPATTLPTTTAQTQTHRLQPLDPSTFRPSLMAVKGLPVKNPDSQPLKRRPHSAHVGLHAPVVVGILACQVAARQEAPEAG